MKYIPSKLLTTVYKKFASHKKIYFPLAGVTLFVFALLSLWSYSTFPVTNSTDSSWMYSLSGLRHVSQTLGVDVFFTYGPLFEIMPTVVHANDSLQNFIIGNFLFLFILAVTVWAAWQAYQFARKHLGKHSIFLLICGVATILLTVTDTDTAFNILMLITLFACRLQKSYALKLLMLSGIYLLALYKFSYLLPLVILTPLAFIKTLHWKEIAKGIGLSAGVLPLCWAMFAALTHNVSPLHFIDYMRVGVTNSIYYGEFMSLPFSLFQPFLVGYGIFFAIMTGSFLLAAALVVRRKGLIGSSDYIFIGLMILAVTFFDLKHAVVRNDIHLLSFTPFLFIGTLFVYYNVAQLHKKLSRIFMAYSRPALIIIGTTFVIAHGVILGNLLNLPWTTVNKDQRLALGRLATIDNRLNYAYFLHVRDLSRQNIKTRAGEIKNISAQLDQAYPRGTTLIVYGNTTLYGEALRYKYNVLYPPFLQNYVAHPPQMADKMYIEFLEDNPDALVFAEEVEPSIDKRVPAHEINEFFQYLTFNYKVIAQDAEKGHYVFRRVSNIRETCSTVSKFSFKDGERVDLPALPTRNKNQYFKLKLDPATNLTEKALSLLFKNPVYTMQLITPEEATMNVRTTKTTLEHGVAIEPFNQSLRDFTSQRPFAMKAFVLDNDLSLDTYYDAVIQSCDF